MATIEPIEEELTVPVAPSAALGLWTKDLGHWWPSEYTFSGEKLQSITIEPELGGHCVELDLGGQEVVWGRVLEFDPGGRLAFSWEIGPERDLEDGPEGASEVEISATAADGGGSLVRLVHRGFERHGDGAAEYRQALAAEQGWPWLLGLFSEAAESGT